MRHLRNFETTAYYGLTAILIALFAALLLCAPAFAEEMKEPAGGKGVAPDPQMKAVLDAFEVLDPKPIEMSDAKAARKQPTMADAAISVLKNQGKSTDPEPVGKVVNTKVKAEPDNIPIRIYTPKGDGPFPVLVYYHGGGFVIATMDTYDSSCRALCNMANCIVVSVEYRKAPEYKFPAAVDDSFAAYQWIVNNAASFKGDPKKVAVGGESAGGNLATVVSMLSIEKNFAKPVFQLLVYPVVDNKMDTESYLHNADAKPLNKAMMGWFFTQYLADPNAASDPHVLPMRATKEQLAKLPPAFVIGAQIDPLRSEGKEYADKLKAAGVPMEYKLYHGVTHEFFGLGAMVDTAKMAETDAAEALKRAFAEK